MADKFLGTKAVTKSVNGTLKFAWGTVCSVPHWNWVDDDPKNCSDSPCCKLGTPNSIQVDSGGMYHSGKAIISFYDVDTSVFNCGVTLSFYIDWNDARTVKESITSCSDHFEVATEYPVYFTDGTHKVEVGTIGIDADGVNVGTKVVNGVTTGQCIVNAGYNATCSINVEVWETVSTSSSGLTKPYYGYPYGEPYGAPARQKSIYYKVIGGSISWSGGGISGGYDLGDLRSSKVYTSCVIATDVSISDNASISDTALQQTPRNSLEKAADATVSGSGSTAGHTYSGAANLDGWGSGYREKQVLNGCTIECWGNGNGCGELRISSQVSPFTVTYTGTIADSDGTPRSGVKIKTGEIGEDNEVSATTDSYGQFILTKQYQGNVGVNGFYDEWTYDVNDYNTIHSAWIDNCNSIGEFSFENLIVDPQAGSDWGSFSDKRVTIRVSDYNWSNASSLHIASYKTKMTFDAESTDLSAWQVYPANAATFSKDSTTGKLKVLVAGNAPDSIKIYRNFSSGVKSLAAARYLNLRYSSEVSDKINININNTVKKDVSQPTSYTSYDSSNSIDVIGDIINTSAVDTSQNYYFGTPTGFGWGIGDVSYIEITKLKAGASYVFNELTQVLKNTPHYILTDGVFVGEEPGDSRSSDEHGMIHDWRQDKVEGNTTTTVYKSRFGFIMDGNTPIAELYDCDHMKVSNSSTTWSHVPVTPDDDGTRLLFPIPANGIVSYTPATIGSHEWQIPSNYTASDFIAVQNGMNINLSLAIDVDSVECPTDYLTDFSCKKVLRGKLIAQFLTKDGKPASNADVTHNIYDKSKPDAIKTTESLKTSDDGCIVITRVQSSCIALGVIKTITNNNKTYELETLTPSGTFIGHNAIVAPYDSSSNPSVCKIVAQDGLTITFETAPASVPVARQLIQIVKNYQHEFICKDSSGNDITAVVSCRNRGVTFVTVKGIFIVTNGGLSIAKDAFRTFISYNSNSKLNVDRYKDGDWLNKNQLTYDNSDIILAPNSYIHMFGQVNESGTDYIYRHTSFDGTNFGTGVKIMAGSSPRIVRNPVTGLFLLYTYNTAKDTIQLATSEDNGYNWTDQGYTYLVGEEAPFDVAFCEKDKPSFIMVINKTSGIQTIHLDMEGKELI